MKKIAIILALLLTLSIPAFAEYTYEYQPFTQVTKIATTNYGDDYFSSNNAYIFGWYQSSTGNYQYVVASEYSSFDFYLGYSVNDLVHVSYNNDSEYSQTDQLYYAILATVFTSLTTTEIPVYNFLDVGLEELRAYINSVEPTPTPTPTPNPTPTPTPTPAPTPVPTSTPMLPGDQTAQIQLFTSVISSIWTGLSTVTVPFINIPVTSLFLGMFVATFSIMILRPILGLGNSALSGISKSVKISKGKTKQTTSKPKGG